MVELECPALRFHKDVFDEFHGLMKTTNRDQNELLRLLIAVYKRFGNGFVANHKKDQLSKALEEPTELSRLTIKSKDVRDSMCYGTKEREVTRNEIHVEPPFSALKCKSQRRHLRTKRRLKKYNKNLMKAKSLNPPEIPNLDVSNFSLQLSSLEIGDINTGHGSPHQIQKDFGNLSSRRSLRKATSPKRKQTESMQLDAETICGSPDILDSEKTSPLSSTITPKRRRKNKPQKLVQQMSADDNSTSEPENEVHVLAVDVVQGTINTFNHIQSHRERKSKTKAKAVIGEITEALLDVKMKSPKSDDAKCTESQSETATANVESIELEENPLFDISGQDSPFDICIGNADEDNKPKASWTSLEYISTPPKLGRPRGSRTRPVVERRPYKCEHCQASFKRPAHLIRHVDVMHSGYAPHRCRGCGKKVNSEMSLRYHEGFGCKVLKLPFECKACLIRFDSEDDVSSHRCSGDPKKKCVCPNCDYKTASPRDMDQHLKIHTGEKSFKCDQCDFSTAWKKNLKEHALKHTGVKPFVCDICGYATNDPHNLRAHKFTHLTEKSFMCEICGAKFREARLLKGHQLVHSTSKPFKCTMCKYSCKHKSSLRYHMTSHSNAKKFMCEQCGQSFRSKRHMTRHQKTVHQDTNLIYGCRYCDFTAPVSQSLNSHMRKHSKKNKKGSPSRHSVKERPVDETMKVSTEAVNVGLTRQDQIGDLFRFDVPPQENSQHSLSSSAVDLIPADIKPLDGLATIGTQDLHDARSMHHESPLLSQLSISPGDVLAVLPCFNTNSTAFQSVYSNPEPGESIRPQYEELLFNSNASQAETISTMMSLIREFRPR